MIMMSISNDDGLNMAQPPKSRACQLSSQHGSMLQSYTQWVTHCRRVIPVMMCISVVAAFAGQCLSQTTDEKSTSIMKSKSESMNYPTTKQVKVSDNYHGTTIQDPYRWLEDTESSETAAWVESQNKTTFAYLETIPLREKLRERLTKLWNYERYGQPIKYGSRYFFTHNNGLQNQSVLYTAESIESPRQLLLDPNTLRDDGTVALSGWVPSDDGKYLAYGLAAAGSDWNTWTIRDVATQKDLPEKLEWIKFSSVSWTKDGKGFFYGRYDAPEAGKEFSGVNYFQKLYYHRLGTTQTEDVLIYKRDDQKEWGFGATVSEDGNYAIITVWRGTEDKKLVFYMRLPGGSLPEKPEVVELISDFEFEYSFIGNDGGEFYFFTDNNAAKGKLIAIDIAKPTPKDWQILIPEKDEAIEAISLLGDVFFVSYLQDATSLIRRFTVSGQPMDDLKLPGLGTVVGFGGHRDTKETFYSFTNYITPPTIFRLDLTSDQSTVWRKPELDFDSSLFETTRVFYNSKDGTRIPMILSHKKGITLDSNNPTMLYAYGGFNISLTPSFSPANLVWMEMGGIYAVPNLRGGGEYGREWHEAGMLDRKQNVFDDFIGAAKFLIDSKYTQPKRLAISGGSNGGLLVGATMTQRPDLFAAALPKVGVLDMLRFHKFTIGWAWVNEYGSSDDAKQFANLLRYSPLHNLKDGTHYPATMVMTADHDDRVVPGHSFKFAAKLQEAHTGSAPVLIRIETRSGHGAGTPVTKLIEAAADSWAFVAKNVGMK
jgi:prolyl oligopeptidase